MSLLKIEIDFIAEHTPIDKVAIMQEMADYLDSNKNSEMSANNIKQELISLDGPSSHPVFHLTGTKEELEQFVKVYTNGNDELETFLI